MTLHLYCHMPNHLHLVVQVGSSNLINMVSELKSATTRAWWSHGGKGRLWQPSFHDHGIRTADDFETIASYVIDNPVRAGIVDEWEDYPFVGGAITERES
jgi:REP element-mobilizing transposase RayT